MNAARKLSPGAAALTALIIAGCSANSGGPPDDPPIFPNVFTPPPAVTLSLTPESIQPGGSGTLTWTASNAAECEASGAWSGSQATSNNVGVSTGALSSSGTHSFSLTCTGAGGSGSAVQTMVVGSVPAPIIEVHIEPTIAKEGEDARLTWHVVHATSCWGTGGMSDDEWVGTQPHSSLNGLVLDDVEEGEHWYTLECSGPGGTSSGTKFLKVMDVAPPAAPTISFHTDDGALLPGESAELEWTTTNATSCTGSGGAPGDGWAGTRPLNSIGTSTGVLNTAGSYSYILTCSGDGGSTSAHTVVTVSATPQPVVVELQVSPSSLTNGQSAQLSWSTAHANSCTASGSWSGARPLNASAVSTGALPTGTYSFSLTCAGPGGSTTDTAVVTVDPAAADISTFSANPTVIQTGQNITLAWQSAGSTSCTATGGSGSDGWNGAVSLSHAGLSVGPLAAGNYTYTLNCTGPGGPSGPRNVNITVNPAPATPATIDNLIVAPNNINTGQSTTLAWSTSNASSCTASGGAAGDGWAGARATASNGIVVGPIAAAGNYTYTLNCTGPGGASAPANASLVVTPAAPPAAVSTFTATPDTINVGQSTTLAWSTSNAASCAASGGSGADSWTGTVATSSSGTVIGPLGNPGVFHYTLSCSGPGGTSGPSTTTVTVVVPTPPATVSTLDLTPNNISVGQSTVISWNSSNASSCTATGGASGDGWAGAMPTSSSGLAIGPINVAGSYTYTLQCSGPGGTGPATSGSLLVGAGTPPASITALNATPTTLQTGQSTSLDWATTNATSCTASGGASGDGWTGSVGTSSAGFAVGPINVAGSYQYRLNCTGPGGSSNASSVTVDVTAPPPPASITSLSLTPSNIHTGDSTSLSWTTSGASSCTASGGSGSDGWTGSVTTSSTGTSVGPLNAAGSYTYTLSCTGAGGASAPSSATLTVTAATPPAAVTALTATPGTVQVGQSTSLAWSTTNATACAATGGSSGDGWSGAVPTSSSGTTVGPLGTPGLFTYTLTCSGTGGSSGPRSETVSVNALPPPAATIDTFQLSPTTITSGQSATISWTSSNATSCTASGGVTGDSWAGAKTTSSGGTVVGPIATVGSQQYTLTCTGPGGSSAPSSATLTVNAPPVGPPTVSMTASNQNPLQVEPNQAFTLRWASTNANSCSALGGTGSDGWSGNQPVTSTGLNISGISTPGIYTYTLSCLGPAGSGVGSVVVTVLPSTSASCGIGVPSLAMRSPSASVGTAVGGVLCLLCGTVNPSRIIDSSANNSATMVVTAGVLATASAWVTDTTTDYPAGRRAGFLLSRPNQLLTLSAIPNITVKTLLNGVEQESATSTNLLSLTALGLFSDPNEAFLGFTTTKPFDTVRLDVGSLASVLETLNIYSGCVTLQ